MGKQYFLEKIYSLKWFKLIPQRFVSLSKWEASLRNFLNGFYSLHI